ncbi:hypothetical protein D3C80_1711320 [compost metagenome]
MLDVVHPRQQQGAALLIEPERKLLQIGAIGADRVVRQPSLQPECIEKGLDQGMVVLGGGGLGHGFESSTKGAPL